VATGESALYANIILKKGVGQPNNKGCLDAAQGWGCFVRRAGTDRARSHRLGMKFVFADLSDRESNRFGASKKPGVEPGF
jgi:hypothetical protein